MLFELAFGVPMVLGILQAAAAAARGVAAAG
jgi:hypothetical protein